MDMKKASIRGALFAMTLAAAMATSAEIYKWQDEEGTWHFSETPPNNQAVEKIDVRITPPSADQQGRDDSNKPAAEAKDSKADDQPLPLSPEIAAAEKERKAHNCRVARENLANLQTRERIRYRDQEKGVERYLTADERNQWEEKSRKEIAENCE